MFKPAPFTKRALAFIIDTILLNIVTFPLLFFGGQEILHLLVSALLSGVFYFIYFVAMEARYGQTLGKLAVGIEVAYRSRDTLGPAILRNLTKAISAFFPFLLILDVIPMFFDEDRKRFSDLIAGTRVVILWRKSW